MMLELQNITLSFPGVFAPVLSNINFSLKRGEFCVVIGPNGSGKSSLMKIVSGEYQPTSGEVLCSGAISQVGQDTNKGTVSSMTLLENIALSQMQHKAPKLQFYKRHEKDILSKIASLKMGLEDYLHQPIETLSGGQRQIIATLMAMTSGGELLLLDEHTSALDPKMQAKLMEYTSQSISELGLSSLMITHKMDDAIRYGDRLIMLSQGKIVFDVSGESKAKLKTQELIALFHKHEDLGFQSKGAS